MTKYYHFRIFSREKSAKVRKMESAGGITLGIVEEGPLNVVYVARCSTKENYSKSKGRIIIEGRIVKKKICDTVIGEINTDILRAICVREFRRNENSRVKRLLKHNGLIAMKGEMEWVKGPKKLRVPTHLKESQVQRLELPKPDQENQSTGPVTEEESIFSPDLEKNPMRHSSASQTNTPA